LTAVGSASARLLILALLGCRVGAPGGGAASLDPTHAASMVDSVRAFADSVARGITTRGPVAWRDYLADDPAFFMASEGRLVFPNHEAASQTIEALRHQITEIQLRWGDSLRVDPLAPGLAVLAASYHETRVDTTGKRLEEDGFFTGLVEHRAGRWQLRDAHWSVVTPPPAVP